MTMGNVKMVVPSESTPSVDKNNDTEVEKKVITKSQYIETSKHRICCIKRIFLYQK